MRVGAILFLVCLFSAFAAEPTKEHADVTAARVKFELEIANAIKPIEKRYRARLEVLQKELARKKDLEGAESAKMALDELKANPPSAQQGASIEGTWVIKYSNGSTRTYTVLPDGGVRFWETANVGKVTWDQDSWVFDFGDGKFERVAVKRKLEIEHYLSRAEFEDRKTTIVGSGAKRE